MGIKQTEARHGLEAQGVEETRVLSLLRADPDIGVGIPADRLAEAARVCATRVLAAPGPELDPEAATAGDSGYGLLLLSGVLCRCIARDGRSGAELIGPGDLIRPNDPAAEWASLPLDCTWTVLMPARLAVLDRSFARRAAAFPEISIALNRRSLRRSARLAALISTLSQPRVENRLIALFWHLADRFGKTRREGIYIPLPLTHKLLAELVAARRPSVTTALAHLRDEGSLLRDGKGWLLRGPGWEPLLSGAAASASWGGSDASAESPSPPAAA